MWCRSLFSVINYIYNALYTMGYIKEIVLHVCDIFPHLIKECCIDIRTFVRLQVSTWLSQYNGLGGMGIHLLASEEAIPSRSCVFSLYRTVYPNKYAHGFVVLCFVVVMQSFIMNSHEVFIHIHQGCFAGTGAIVRLPQCQWSKHDGYGKISQCITTTKHSKAKTMCIFLGIYCTLNYETFN